MTDSEFIRRWLREWVRAALRIGFAVLVLMAVFLGLDTATRVLFPEPWDGVVFIAILTLALAGYFAYLKVKVAKR